MDYRQTIDFIETSNWMGSRLGLERIRRLLSLAGDPQNAYRCVHVAGTNGKGSTAAMIASVLREAGYKTGLYTSPHLRRYNERINIDGADISDEDMCEAAEILAGCVEKMDDEPTVFERISAMAFLAFKLKGCDAAVVEVGLGGRLDATNVIDSTACSVIAHIDLDHTEVLGNSIAQIASEKAGIIKRGRPAAIMTQSPEAAEVLKRVCVEMGSPCAFTSPEKLILRKAGLDGQSFDYRERRGLFIPLCGVYQLPNACLAADAVDVLNAEGWDISEEAVFRGFANVRWDGRFQVLQKDPPVIADGAHNPDGARQLAEGLRRYLGGRKLTFIMGVMRDKDFRGMISSVAPLAERFITVTPRSERSLPSSELAEVISGEFGIEACDASDMETALNAALNEACASSGVCIFGSLYQLGDVLDRFDARRAELREAKRALRERVGKKTAALSRDYLKDAGRAICGRIAGLPEYARAKTVMSFCSLGTEVDMSSLNERILADGKTLALPRCEGKGIMVARKVSSLDELSAGTMGISEPAASAPAAAKEDTDLIVVPCAAAGRDGTRLGKGGGFYDRYMADYAKAAVLVCPEALIEEDIPCEEHDVRIAAVVTERGVYRGEG